MQADLLGHYVAAIADASARNVADKIVELESILDASRATLNVSPSLLRNLAMGDDYVSYYEAMDDGRRDIAQASYHGHRQAVDSVIHTGYEKHILNAALSPSGCGLKNYGEIVLQLRDAAIEERASLMRENAFFFYERYDLGRLGASEQPGWRSIWSERKLLAAAHLAPTITPATPNNVLPDLMMSSGADRRDDNFIEVHIFGRLDWQSIEKATLEVVLASPDLRDDWDFCNMKLTRRGILCSES